MLKLQNAGLLPLDRHQQSSVGRDVQDQPNQAPVIDRMTRASLYCPTVKAKKKKRFLLLFQYTHSKGFREAHAHFSKQICKDRGLGAEKQT